MEIFNFLSFHARSGQEGALEAVLREAVALTRTEPGCLGINIFRSAYDPQTFWVHSHWTGKQAAEAHTRTPFMVRVLETIQELTTEQLNVASAFLIA